MWVVTLLDSIKIVLKCFKTVQGKKLGVISIKNNTNFSWILSGGHYVLQTRLQHLISQGTILRVPNPKHYVLKVIQWAWYIVILRVGITVSNQTLNISIVKFITLYISSFTSVQMRYFRTRISILEIWDLRTEISAKVTS